MPVITRGKKKIGKYHTAIPDVKKTKKIRTSSQSFLVLGISPTLKPVLWSMYAKPRMLVVISRTLKKVAGSSAPPMGFPVSSKGRGIPL